MPSLGIGEIGITGLGAGGNWLAAVERIKEELFRKKPGEEDIIKRALITACEFYRWHRFDFNEGSGSWFTEAADTAEYGPESTIGLGNGYPLDLLDIDEMYVFTTPVDPPIADPSAALGLPPGTIGDISGGPQGGQAQRMKRVHMDKMRYWLDGSSASGARPHHYSWHHDRILLYPKPNDTYRIKVDYLRDLDFPKYTFTGGEWKYVNSSGDPIDDDYNTPWLLHAEELIRNRAKADLWANVFYKQDQAALSREQEREAFKNLARRTQKRKSTGRMRPWYGGY